MLTYRASVGEAGVEISYDIDPQTYLTSVTGRVSGTTGPAFLLVDMPPSLPIAESDTLSDLRTLSYSFKPAAQQFTRSSVREARSRREASGSGAADMGGCS